MGNIPWAGMGQHAFVFPMRLQINPLSPAKAPNLAEFCNPITRQAIELENYPNHPRIQQVL